MKPTTRAAALLLAILAGTIARGSARAEDPPPFVLAWGTAGSGPGQFLFPSGLATDAAGNVYVADPGNNRFQKFTRDGVFLGEGGLPNGSDPGLYHPADLAVDGAGNIYVQDGSRPPGLQPRIVVYDQSFQMLRQWPVAGGYRVALDPTGQYLYSLSISTVYEHTVDGVFVRSWPSGGTGLSVVSAIGVGPSGNVYVADSGDDLVRKYTATGQFITQWGGHGVTDGLFTQPTGVAVDGNERVFVSDATNRIQKFTDAGEFLVSWGSSGSGDGQFGGPSDVAIGLGGSIYVSDQGNNRIQKFQSLPVGSARITWGGLKVRYR